MGWSDGGVTAMILAAKNPDLVKNLIIWGANAYITENDMKIFNSNSYSFLFRILFQCMKRYYLQVP